MANATGIVKKGVVRRTDEFLKRSAATLASQTRFYIHAMLGTTAAGFLAKFDDTQPMTLAGVVRGDQGNPVLPAGTANDGTIDLDVHQPFRFELAVAGVTAGDVGKKVYAADDQTGVLSPAALASANLVGTVADVAATGVALVDPCYDGVSAHARLGAARFLAATGAQSLTRADLNKTVFLPNTAAYAVTLPAAADTQAGDRLTFVKTTADAFAVTLDPNAAETVDGASTLATIDAQFDTAVLVSTGSAWVVLSRDIA